MSERRCPVCGRSFLQRTGQHRFCTPVCRERARALVRVAGSPARYGHKHKKLRQAVAVQVAAGGVGCARCGGLIIRGDAWDLDHKDGGEGYLGPSHASCNRATASRGRVESYEDDPERGIFWGPPDDRGGPPRRWSRPWFEWRKTRPTL
jgi:hypothetical protein